ncbi:uncharacterized protein PV09_00003 [Verruconis gallopava]|uniref:MaoC-like domain-containing protein n=1 Tax=Verruconis gallopava TaxID=253628 RepID=A0A0D2BCH0_9PEZI|nr:uncharacterized protein PV09_00003 [Verruconis gallopava]KIW09054.1 hypothetical protein PV09_00003 [Verruconis gallopava]
MAQFIMFSRPMRHGCRTHWASTRALLLTLARRQKSDFSHLQTELPARVLPILYDDLTSRATHNLNVSLASFVPDSWLPKSTFEDSLPVTSPSLELPASHHLVYFNPALPPSKLLPDGTDPNQSPGVPFVRRMWAGGNVRWKAPLKVDGSRHACVEGIRNVTIKGQPGQEKVFVGIERRIGAIGKDMGDHEVRKKLWAETEDDFADADIIERRNIVFMYERTEEELEKVKKRGAAMPADKMLKPQNQPTFTHTLTPTPTLLFRYSALTFNAHAIHLDPQYCREVEGHRNLLFHGPLSFTLLTLMVDNHVKSQGKTIASIDYRNLAPLYCSEPVKLCGRESGPDKFEVWVETPEGGIAVKGSATVRTI